MYATKPDGTMLVYEEHGAGEPAMVFVHSLGVPNHYRHQIDHFAPRHRIIAPTLAGFGASTAPVQRDLTFAQWAEDLAWLCEQLDLRAAVIVGHSMSGAIALELAATHPGLVGAVVLLDPVPVAPLPAFRQGIGGLAQALGGPNYRDALRDFAEARMFRETDDSALRSQLVEDMCAVPQHVLVGVFAGLLAWDGEEVAGHVKAPILQIVQGGGMPVDVARIQAVLPDLEFGQTVGAGHWAHLIVPDQVNSMIERFLAVHL
ncbi:alpha/beta fold hydrolase [Sinomonas sp. P10A9]|uniref:Alpha/beta fold hydrolase n=1 Tax=Sinomonas puerhi TaxID=3238584 RepID=A0AB39L1S0_9MICC